jgi:hypothetical protein
MYEREQGIQAIIELQLMAGITESEEKASKGWDAMRDSEKESTTKAHQMFLGGFQKQSHT